ncbi:hypothetical protein MTBPR1_20066 [Candidatus Terasakiella magnetica]|uniref:Glycosyl transferase family 1 domain-containing protein n=1 Tax=Candidatus Terasakiella magnetica TaxID=1867952 RepID=A0A1C3RG47_9PROT|nr:glycosyltransferase family 4 protein [Candidatus Terasakiella magnetica]SCA56218.1 hypothetical protein MTBPR1_20066 [Candidatus Terasakiella magnetica]
MRVIYISNFVLSGKMSPSVNERQFVHSLEKNLPGEVFYFIKDGPVEIDLPQDRVRFFKETPSFSKPWQCLKHAYQWAKEVKELYKTHKADVVVIRFGDNPLKEYFLTKMLPQRVFVKSLGLYQLQGEPINLMDRVLRYYHNWISEAFFRNCAGVEAVTAGYAERVEKGGVKKERIFVVSNSVPTDVFFPKQALSCPVYVPENAFPVIGYAGGLPEEKGGMEIIGLLKRLKDEYPHAHGVIVGRSEKLNVLKAYAEECGVSQQCTIHEWLALSQMPALLERFDLGVSFAPSYFLVGGNASMKIRQYLAMGIPVISQPQSNDFLLENDLGLVVEQDNFLSIEGEVRDWIVRLSKNKGEIRQRLHQYAQENLSSDFALNERIKNWSRLTKEMDR